MPELHPEPPAKRTLKSSPKLAALVVLVMLLVATPAVQVWRHYGFQVQSLLLARDATEPMAAAVGTQRAVVAHQALARTLLLGDRSAEASRRAQQTTADNGFSALAHALALRHFDAALLETQSAASDWMALLDALRGRPWTPAASDHAHHLVVEQLVQVIDLLGDAAALHGAAGQPLTDYARAQTAAAAWLAVLAQTEAQQALPGALAQRTRRALAAWQNLQNAQSERHNPALEQAAQHVVQALRAVQHLPAAQARAQTAPVLQALAAAGAPLTQQWQQALQQQAQDLERNRALWLALIALQAAALVGVLRLALRPPPATPGPEALSFAADAATPLPLWTPVRDLHSSALAAAKLAPTAAGASAAESTQAEPTRAL